MGVATNYLSEKEIAALNRVVTMYLDYAEDQAERQSPMHMAEWVKKLDAFLTFNERNILTNAGKVSAAAAEGYASREFEKFDRARLEGEVARGGGVSDFDAFVERAKRLKTRSAEKPTKKRKKKEE